MSVSTTRPTFLICGAQKAGTTAIYEALSSHPDVCMSRPKETEFFNWRYRRGWEWFGSHFDHYDGEAAVGEASTRTMPTPEAPHRIAERLPHVKLIFVLRDPVERAHSAFWYYVMQGILCPEEDFGAFIRNEGHPLRQEIIHYGFYERHLSRFLDHFSATQCLLIRYEDVREFPEKALQQVCRFIGVDSVEDTTLSSQTNVTRYPVSQRGYALGRQLWEPLERATSALMPRLTKQIRRWGREWLLGSDRPSLTPGDRQYLSRVYESTAKELEKRFALDLSGWSAHPRN